MSGHEQRLRSGELAVLPTDTVYGVACAAYLPIACQRLYGLKERPSAQPIALVAGSVDELLSNILPELRGRTGAIVSELLPGPVTLVVCNPGRRFPYLCGDRPVAIGVRVPVLVPEVAALADAVGGLAMTSANPRGASAPSRLEDVDAAIRNAVTVAIDGGTLPGSPSAVLDITGRDPVVVRDGPGTEAALEAIARLG